MDPCARWTAALEEWRLPQWLLDAAPQSPYTPPHAILATPTTDPLGTPTGRLVAEGLGRHGTLLDLGCGAGRFSAAFVGPHRVVGVERNDRLADTAEERGIHVTRGSWPDVDDVPHADVASCTHVLYDVPDPRPFLQAMGRHARRLVFELTDHHPWAGLGPLYRHFHDLDRPTGPTADHATEMIADVLGVAPSVQRWELPGWTYPSLEDMAAHRRRQLCLTPAAADALAARLTGTYEQEPDGTLRLPPRPCTTLWLESPQTG